MRTEKLTFTGSQGHSLAGRMDRPDGPARATAPFAHCFTCTKDIFAAANIARTLTEAGFAVLRFDFTGLGHSDGEFANTNFSSNVEDLVAAANHLRRHGAAPQLLIGHSLGGAAVLAAAGEVPEVRALATIGAPSSPIHVSHLFRDRVETIRGEGEAEVTLAGRPFRIRRHFLEDIESHRLAERIGRLRRPLMILHAPRDRIVGIDNAAEIFQAARHPKSFVSLDDADHLLSRHADAAFVARLLACWAERYLDIPAAERAEETHDVPPGEVVVAESGEGRYRQTISAGRHRLVADEPATVGGDDAGPGPYDYLLTALGACTAMTLRMYAERKGLPLEKVEVYVTHDKIHASDCEECETTTGKIDRIDRILKLHGQLDGETRTRLKEIADKCPVHRTLTHENLIVTRLADTS